MQIARGRSIIYSRAMGSAPEDDPTTQQLRAVQADREVEERERAKDAPTDTEQLAAVRRAEKAGYLKEKLEEKAESERS
jgi:hypothetical protein